MTVVSALYDQARGDVRAFTSGYFQQLAALLARLDVDGIGAFIAVLEKARLAGQTVFIIGNGGSAATASHMANDLLNVTYKSGASPGFRIVALTDNLATFSAIANDDGYDQVFVRQLATLCRPGDVLISISASGNSPNIVKAAQWAREHGAINLGLLGFDGGRMRPLCDVAVVVGTERGDYGLVEDAHMILDHVVTSWFHQSLRERSSTARAD
jgi:D-sedoheptulose 7-phosphate isomerase